MATPNQRLLDYLYETKHATMRTIAALEKQKDFADEAGAQIHKATLSLKKEHLDFCETVITEYLEGCELKD